MKSLKIPEFRLKAQNSDFRVKEIFYLPDELSPNKSTYTYLVVEKSGLTTFQLQDILVKALSLNYEDLSTSGLKDEQAITTQIVSVRKIINMGELEGINASLNKIPEGEVKITGIAGYGKQPVLPKILHGNEFKITLRNLSDNTAKKLKDRVTSNRYHNFINYYDEQRFGTPDSIHNTHLIGKYLLNKKWELAYKEYLKSGNGGEELKKVQDEYTKTKSARKALMIINKNKRDFFVSAYNSYLWNSKLSTSLKNKKGLSVNFPYIGELALPTKTSTNVATILSIKAKEYDWEKGRSVTVTKSRPVNIVTAAYLVKEEKDTLFPGKRAVTLSFVLPTGCYATMFIKQLLTK